MVTSYIFLAAFVAVVKCNPGDPPGNEFIPPAPGTAERSPCPYLNTLANHGFLPRDGTNITREQTNNAFDVVFNVDPEITNNIFTAALAGTSSSAPDTINLVDLDQHGLIEHDVSLSRADAAIGNNFIFNSTIWDTFMAHFPDPLITISQMAAARADRITAAAAANPVLNFGTAMAMTNLGETSLVMLTFANGSTDGGAIRQQVDTFFREERVPFDQGYVRPAERITAERVMLMGQELTFATDPTSAAASGMAASGSGLCVSGRLSMMSVLFVAGLAGSFLL